MCFRWLANRWLEHRENVRREKGKREALRIAVKRDLAELDETIALRDVRRRETLQRAKQQREEQRSKARKNLAWLDRELNLTETRCLELDKEMERLLRCHMVADSFEELYSYIPSYAGSNLTADEFDYCKRWLYSRGLRGMLRYDDERLK